MPFDLIIWDCDGCLVDSEVISCGIEARLLTDLGYPISAEGYIHRFAGQSRETAMVTVEKETGRSFRGQYDPQKYAQAVLDEFTESLQTPTGMLEVMKDLSAESCIASGSSIARNTHALTVTGLLPYFENKIFSSLDVAHGKPAPDIFLHAARVMGVESRKCLVIEDSIHGIAAAKAAGMPVFAFLGGSHVNQAWRDRVEKAQPDLIFDNMRCLPDLIKKYPESRILNPES